MIKNRLTAGLLSSVLLWSGSALAENKPSMTVYRSASCSCCSKWVKHIENNGYDVVDKIVEDVNPVKQRLKVPFQLASCHTAMVDGYVIEGHVPAQDIDALLAKKPAVAGLSVPGMPAGTPGMEMGGRVDAYNVVAFDRDGGQRIFRSVGQ
ncbi:MAG: DUF411 domain-containing protein [Methylococcales bacterium]|nr:DUF411 domain-containing protein [Methylococcales bacterium]